MENQKNQNGARETGSNSSQNTGQSKPVFPFKGKIQKLESSLYSRQKDFSGEFERGKFSSHSPEADTDWRHSGESSIEDDIEKHKRQNSFLKKFFTGAVIFFVLSFGAAMYLFYAGSNTVSPNNISVDVKGPVEVSGGQSFPLDIIVKNENNSDLQDVNLSIEYPDGAYTASDPKAELSRDSQIIGVISAGGFADRTFNSSFFGEKDSVKEMKISIEYKVGNSNTVFKKEKLYDMKISSEPVSVAVDYLKEINSNQREDFVLNVSSNSDYPLKNLMISAEYPRGFTFENSLPLPAFGNNIWLVGELKPAQKIQIKFSGKVQGQDGEDVTFRFHAGLQSQKNEKELAVDFLPLTQTVSIKKPFMSADLWLNGDNSAEHIENIGSQIKGEIGWMNNLPTAITDAEVTATIRGNILDKYSVSIANGVYKSEPGQLVWDARSFSPFKQIDAGGSGKLTFDFSTLKLNSNLISKLKNPVLYIDLSVKGKRLSENNVPEQLDSTVTKKIKIATNLNLTSRVLYYDGPFKNRGPIPPKADTPTTYTVTLTTTDTFNDIAGAVAKTSLPAYVKWLGAVSPSSEDISYKPLTGEVVWNIGDLKAGTGFSTLPKEVSFQVQVTPGLNQLNQEPFVTGGTTISGQDVFTGVKINGAYDALTTNLLSDPKGGSDDRLSKVTK